MFRKFKVYFSETLWNFPLHEKSGLSYLYTKWLRIFVLSFRGFFKDQCLSRASSLTYYTMTSIAPILAILFAIAKKIGLYESFKRQILSQFSLQKEALIDFFNYADELLAKTSGGLIASFGLILLFVSGAFLFSNLDAVVNDIWKTRGGRTWWRLLSDYFALVLFAPVFFVMGSTFSFFLVRRFSFFIQLLPLPEGWTGWFLFFVGLLPYCFIWILFSLLYQFLPATKVRASSAWISGVFAGTLYLLAQWAYIYFQIGTAKFGAIYGSLATILLFLLWLQVSWSLFLFGVQMSCAHQNLDFHEDGSCADFASLKIKEVLALWTIALALKKGSISETSLFEEYQVPRKLGSSILQQIENCLLFDQYKDLYFPKPELLNMHVFELLSLLRKNREIQVPFAEEKGFSFFLSLYDEFEEMIKKHPKNVRIQDVSNSI